MKRPAAYLIDLADELDTLGLDLLGASRLPLRTFQDPFAGLIEVRREAPHRLIVNAPDLSPRTERFLRALDAIRADIPVVLLLPQGKKPPRERSELLGKYEVVDKPFIHRELGRILGGRVESPGASAAPTPAPAAPPSASDPEPPSSDESSVSGAAQDRIRMLEDEIAWSHAMANRLGNLDEILRLLLERAVLLLGATRGSIQFLDERGRELRVHKAIGPGASLLEEMVRPAGGGIAGNVVRQRRPQSGPDGVPETDAVPRPARAELAGPYLSVPLLFGGKVFGVIHVVRAMNGESFEEIDSRRLTELVGAVSGYIRNAMDLEEKERLALVDPLTELYNRRSFDLQFDREIRRAQRYRHALTLVLLDIDDFKLYNDRHGYLAGDDVLRRVGRVLDRTFRQVDVVTRWGGEEFAVLLPETPKAAVGPDGELPPFAERLLRAVERERFQHGKAQPGGRLTLSGGTATYPDDTQDPGELIALANRALRKAKKAGKARIEFV